MSKKTVFSAVCLLLLAVILSLALLSCEKEHVHTESAWIYDERATCAVSGQRHRECTECGELLEEEEYIVGHQYEDEICVFCETPRYGIDFLEYREITLDGVVGYEIVGIGNCTGNKLDIPALRRNKPVLSIAASAFKNNEKLISVHIGKNVRRIGEGAFEGCKNLVAVTFSDNSLLKTIGNRALVNCTSLESFAFPSGVTALPDSVFYNCTALKTVVLSDAMTSFGANAFDGCFKIEALEVNGLRYLPTKTNPTFMVYGVVDSKATAYSIADTAKAVGPDAFGGCRGLLSIAIPEGVLCIGESAFEGCASLAAVSLPTSLSVIGSSAFAGCISLAEVTLPAGLTALGERAFVDCTQLLAVRLDSTKLSFVGANVFGGTKFQPTLFEGGYYLCDQNGSFSVLLGVAEGLTALSVAAGTRVVADAAFYGVSTLTAVTLPASLVTLGAEAFSGCTALDAVTFAAGTAWYLAEHPFATAGEAADVTDAAAAADKLTGEWLYRYLKKV